jgi:dTDP-4-amino-4,6-dideoxygalactose transaminase
VLYKSHADLTPDLNDIAAKLTSNVRCLLVVHYFGFPQNLRQLRALCDARGISLIEDCAHCFFGEFEGKPIGSYGDYAITSPMKFFPIYDGGLLVSAKHSLAGLRLRSGSVPFQFKALVNNLERSFGYARLRPFNWLMAPALFLKDRLWSLAKSLRTPLAREGFGPNTSDGSYAFDPTWIDVKMSTASAALLSATSVSRLVARRRRHYEALLAAFTGRSDCRPLYPDLGGTVVPYVFPLIVDNPRRSFPRLKMRGVPLFRWEDIDYSVCEKSRFYSQHLYQLPCHQELSDDELSWLITEVKLALEL